MWRFIRRKLDLIITDWKRWWKEVSRRIYEWRILKPETEIMKQAPRSRIREQNSLARLNFCRDVLQRVGVLSVRGKRHLKPLDLTCVVFSDEKFFRWNYEGPSLLSFCLSAFLFLFICILLLSSSSSSSLSFHGFQFSLILSMIFAIYVQLNPIFSIFCSFIQLIVLVNSSTDPKTMRKKGASWDTILNFRNFGRFWSPNSDLSDGQARANCEKFLARKVHVRSAPYPCQFHFWAKLSTIFQLDPPEKHWRLKPNRG